MAVAAKKNYRAIAERKITKPSTQPERLPNLLVYSRNKKGKTHFCTTAPDVLILDPEHGTDHFLKRDPNVWHIEQWEDMDDAYKYLRTVDHGFKWVSVDGLTKISNMSLRWVMHQQEEHDLSRRPGMVMQKDYGKAGELMKGMLYNFHNLPMGVIFTAQERQIEGSFGDDDEDSEDSTAQFVSDLPRGVRSTVNSIVDCVGRLYTVKVEKEDKRLIQRRLWVEPNVMYDTGYRSDYVLPSFIRNPTVPRLVKLMKEGTIR